MHVIGRIALAHESTRAQSEDQGRSVLARVEVN